MINVQVQGQLISVGPSPGNWQAVHRVDLAFGRTDICICVAKFCGMIPFLSSSQILSFPIYIISHRLHSDKFQIYQIHCI